MNTMYVNLAYMHYIGIMTTLYPHYIGICGPDGVKIQAGTTQVLTSALINAVIYIC